MADPTLEDALDFKRTNTVYRIGHLADDDLLTWYRQYVAQSRAWLEAHSA